MKKTYLLLGVLAVLISACIPSLPATDSTASPPPITEADLEGTSAVLVKQTLASLPTPTIAPTKTPLIASPTSTQTLETLAFSPTSEIEPASTETRTQNPATATSTSQNPSVVSVSITSTPTSPQLIGNATASTETLHPRFYGTLPPDLPSGKIILVNRSKAEVYASLQCTTKDGNVTILEYPVASRVEARAPAGKYIYVVWVGGNKISGKFGLGYEDDLQLTIYKDHVEVKKK